MGINSWLAKECGIETKQTWQGQAWSAGHGFYIYPFDYKDPRCREIIREKLKLTTEVDDDGAYCWDTVDVTFTETGKTISEAECKCIEALHRSSEDE